MVHESPTASGVTPVLLKDKEPDRVMGGVVVEVRQAAVGRGA